MREKNLINREKREREKRQIERNQWEEERAERMIVKTWKERKSGREEVDEFTVTKIEGAKTIYVFHGKRKRIFLGVMLWQRDFFPNFFFGK